MQYEKNIKVRKWQPSFLGAPPPPFKENFTWPVPANHPNFGQPTPTPPPTTMLDVSLTKIVGLTLKLFEIRQLIFWQKFPYYALVAKFSNLIFALFFAGIFGKRSAGK